MSGLILPPGFQRAGRLPTYWIAKDGEQNVKINQFDWPAWQAKGWHIVGERRGNVDGKSEDWHAKQQRIEDKKKHNPAAMAYKDAERAQAASAVTVTNATITALRAAMSETDGSTGSGTDATQEPEPTPAQVQPAGLPAGTVFVDAAVKAPEGGGAIPRKRTSANGGKSAKSSKGAAGS